MMGTGWIIVLVLTLNAFGLGLYFWGYYWGYHNGRRAGEYGND